MTKLLEQVVNEVCKLPEDQQEAIAAVFLEELTSERRWASAFANSQDALEGLADQALAEFRAGKRRA